MIVEYFHDYDKHKIICIWNNRIDGLSKRSILNLYNTVIPVPVKDTPEIDFTANETQNPYGSFLCLFFGAMRYNILLLQFSFIVWDRLCQEPIWWAPGYDHEFVARADRGSFSCGKFVRVFSFFREHL